MYIDTVKRQQVLYDSGQFISNIIQQILINIDTAHIYNINHKLNTVKWIIKIKQISILCETMNPYSHQIITVNMSHQQAKNKRINILKLHLSKDINQTVQVKLPDTIFDQNQLDQLTDTIVRKYKLKKQAKYYIWDHISKALNLSKTLHPKQKYSSNQEFPVVNQKLNKSNNKRVDSLAQSLGIDINKISYQKSPTGNQRSVPKLLHPNAKKKIKKRSKQNIHSENGRKQERLWGAVMQDINAMFDNKKINKTQKIIPKRSQLQNNTNPRKDKNKITPALTERVKTLSDQFRSKLYRIKTENSNASVDCLNNSDYDDEFEKPDSSHLNLQINCKEQAPPELAIVKTPSFLTNTNHKSLRAIYFEDLQRLTQQQMQEIKFERKIRSLYPELSALFCEVQSRSRGECQVMYNKQMERQLDGMLGHLSEQQLQDLDVDEFVGLILKEQNQQILNQLK